MADPASETATGVPPRTVLLASPRAFCAGVERAIETVELALARFGPPVYVRRQIVHNTHVVADLAARGAVFVEELDEVPHESTVVFSAHGVAPAVHTAADERSLQVIDATCPLVAKVHAEARRSDARGEQILLIGHADHEEIEGTRGEAPSRTTIIENVDAARTVQVDDPNRVMCLTQTTLSLQETQRIIEVLRARFPALREPASDDICYATTNRQRALAAIAAESDLVLVLGSSNSSNSQRLAELARQSGTPTHLIDNADALHPDWLRDVRTIGVSAGASAPPGLVEDLVAALRLHGPVHQEERVAAKETVLFQPPSMPSARDGTR